MSVNSTDDSYKPEAHQIIVNGIVGVLGTLAVLLNTVSFIAVLQSRSFPARQKVGFLSLQTTDAMNGFQILSTRLLPIAYTSEHLLCKIRLYCGIILAYATILTNLLITTERFLSIALPMNLNKQITWEKMLICVVFMWITAITLAVSLFFDGFQGPVCEFIVTGNPNGYIVIGFVICIVFLIVLVMYFYIVKVTRRHIRQITATLVGNTPVVDQRHSFRNKADLRTTVTVGVIVGVFGISYCPVGIYCLCVRLLVSDAVAFISTNQTVFTFMVTLYVLNSVVNPIIYIFRLKNCRKEMVARILCRPQPDL